VRRLDQQQHVALGFGELMGGEFLSGFAGIEREAAGVDERCFALELSDQGVRDVGRRVVGLAHAGGLRVAYNRRVRASHRLLGLAVVTAFVLLPVADARACGWDWETYHAEAKSLPCVHDALLGYWPKHTDAYHETRIAAADYGLRWVPGWTEGLDAKGISLLKLGRLEQAEVIMRRRHAIAPDAYPSHANLGTLYTFTGKLDAALLHIDVAMAREPNAHFGREKYHRALVVFLQRVTADPSVAQRENFLGLELSTQQRLHGSAAVFSSLGLEEQAFDALVSMLTVYGADGLPEIYLMLGELLAARGHLRLAYTAYRRARELGHVRNDELGRWVRQLDEQLEAENRKPDNDGRNSYKGIGNTYVSTSRKAEAFQAEWAQWEHEQLAKGLEIWTQAGLDEVYARMQQERRRCDMPGIIDDTRAPLAEEDAP
jgi:tetratricopeptide (TPR) repeat protein